jgi:hypothetical protein
MFLPCENQHHNFSVCCNDVNDCVYDAVCYTTGTSSDLGLPSEDAMGIDGYCNSTLWTDCDTDFNACEINCGYNKI